VLEDDVLDMYVELGLLDHDPYWAALWPSSIALARGVAAAAAADGAGRGEKEGGVEEGGGRGGGEGGGWGSNSVVGRDVCDLGAGLGKDGVET